MEKIDEGLICECGSNDWHPLHITSKEYRQLTENSDFLVRDAACTHPLRSDQEIAERTDRYILVRKINDSSEENDSALD